MPSKFKNNILQKTIIGNAILSAFVICLALVYFKLGEKISEQHNLDILSSDQNHNISLAIKAKKVYYQNLSKVNNELLRFIPHYTDGVVNPLWPWFIGFFASDELIKNPDCEICRLKFFALGKRINLIIAVVFLLIFPIFMRLFWQMRVVSIATFCLLSAFATLLSRSHYFQPEIIFYIFFLLAFLACLRLLNKNDLWAYLALGVLSGVAYLAKSSTAPLLICFFAVSIYRFISLISPKYFGLGENLSANRWSQANFILGSVLLIFSHLLVISPRLIHAHKHYGDALHSYPKYWMWMDNFAEAYRWMGEHNYKQKLVNATDKPSAKTYLAKHSWEDAYERLSHGVSIKLNKFFAPTHTPQSTKVGDKVKAWKSILPMRGVYLLALLAIFFLMAIGVKVVSRLQSQRQKRERLFCLCSSTDFGSIFIFSLGVFALYTLAYGWYTPIGKGERFMLSLYMPMCFVVIYTIDLQIKKLQSSETRRILFELIYYIPLLLTIFIVCRRVVELWRIPLFELVR